MAGDVHRNIVYLVFCRGRDGGAGMTKVKAYAGAGIAVAQALVGFPGPIQEQRDDQITRTML